MNNQFNADAVVIGAGYVGLTLSLHLASKGLNILNVDINENAIKKLKQGESHIFEESIQIALKNCVQSGKIQFSTTVPKEGCNYWVLAISYFPGDKSHYLKVLSNIKGFRNNPPTIMIRGTVPIGYTSQEILPALQKQFNCKLDENFHLASTPERSLSGDALKELENLPQIIGASEISFKKAELMYDKSGIKCLHVPNLEGGEIAKTFTNFARLVQFNLSNFMGVLCHKFQISEDSMYESIRQGYPRLQYLSVPGPGVGGFCLPKDSLVLHDGLKELFQIDDSNKRLVNFPKLQFELNQSIIYSHAEMVLQLLKSKTKVLAMGLAFKGIPRTDDTRDSVGMYIVKYLMKNGINVFAFDRTVPSKNLKENALKVADEPITIAEYDAVLILNNDTGYKNYIRKNLDTEKQIKITLYDPWRQIVKSHETIFQLTYQLK